MLQSACVSVAQPQTNEQVKVERKPFQKSSYVIKSPTEHLERELNNGKSYDPNPKVVIIDEKAGKYEFRWIGTDGKEKVIAYQRHDAIDATVEAKIEKSQDGKLIYKYNFKMLETSPTYVREFIVQTLAADTKPVETENYLLPPPNYKPDYKFMTGQMNFNPLFNVGIWWAYGFVGKNEEQK